MDRTAFNISLGTSALLLGSALAIWASRLPYLHP